MSNEDAVSFSFHSILFDGPGTSPVGEGRQEPECFTDLNLDQVITSLTAGRDEYDLKPFYYAPLSSVGSIRYRQEIFRDLENPELFAHIESFADRMKVMRGQLAQADKLHYKYQKLRWFLDAVDSYCQAVTGLLHDLTESTPQSRGFRAFRTHLASYTKSSRFTALLSETEQGKSDLAAVRYCLHIKRSRVKVTRLGSEVDYSDDVLRTFEKFKQGATKEYRFESRSWKEMNHVEAAVLDLVARLYPETFSALEEYGHRHRNFLDKTIGVFDREVQFYVACLEHIERIKSTGLPFCSPSVSDSSKEIEGRDVFDIALADKLIRENKPVVTNDFYLKDPERIFVVTGPNQGGKTTFARTFGQLHYLASIGMPVPGREAKLFLCDHLFTHFEREEDIRNLSSKLEDDLLRIHGILEHATPRSILIMNESFASTTLSDSLFLSKQFMEEIIRRDMLCASVTFLDELASLGESTVSMVSTIAGDEPSRRTFKIVRRPADGLAHALSIAKKHRLSYDDVKERVRP